MPTAPVVTTGTNPGIENATKQGVIWQDNYEALIGNEDLNPGIGVLINLGRRLNEDFRDLLQTGVSVSPSSSASPSTSPSASGSPSASVSPSSG